MFLSAVASAFICFSFCYYSCKFLTFFLKLFSLSEWQYFSIWLKGALSLEVIQSGWRKNEALAGVFHWLGVCSWVSFRNGIWHVKCRCPQRFRWRKKANWLIQVYLDNSHWNEVLLTFFRQWGASSVVSVVSTQNVFTAQIVWLVGDLSCICSAWHGTPCKYVSEILKHLNIYYMDSPDCLLLFRSISVFYF